MIFPALLFFLAFLNFSKIEYCHRRLCRHRGRRSARKTAPLHELDQQRFSAGFGAGPHGL